MTLIILTVFLALLLPAFSIAGDKPKNKPAGKDTTIKHDSLIGADAPAGGPVIYLPEEVHDFGEANQYTSLKHVFKVVNKGDAVLKLIKVKAS
jgi:hypothetical protein